jgi:hypothetical protein
MATCQTIRWKDFIASHMSVTAGMDFFTVEVLAWRGLATYYVLFLIHHRKVRLAVVVHGELHAFRLRVHHTAFNHRIQIRYCTDVRERYR